MKFGHIGIKVLDIEKTLDFYSKILSAKVIKDYDYPNSRLVFLDVGGTIIELISKADNEPRPLGPIEHIAFKVDSLEEKMALLEDHQVEFTEPRIVGSAQIVFFNGPNNERFEFVARVNS